MGLLDVACRRLIHPLWARREDKQAQTVQHELRRRQLDPPKVVRARQQVALRRVLRHAVAKVPYYRDLFARLRLRVEDIATIEDLQALPLLTKADIRTQTPALLSEHYRNQPLMRKKTSGSTGVPLQVLL